MFAGEPIVKRTLTSLERPCKIAHVQQVLEGKNLEERMPSHGYLGTKHKAKLSTGNWASDSRGARRLHDGLRVTRPGHAGVETGLPLGGRALLWSCHHSRLGVHCQASGVLRASRVRR